MSEPRPRAKVTVHRPPKLAAIPKPAIPGTAAAFFHESVAHLLKTPLSRRPYPRPSRPYRSLRERLKELESKEQPPEQPPEQPAA